MSIGKSHTSSDECIAGPLVPVIGAVRQVPTVVEVNVPSLNTAKL